MISKTNAMRALDQRRIAYSAYDYSADIHSADGVAVALGVSPSEVFKTLVVLRERGRPMLVIVPGDRELAPRVFARSVGEKAVRMAPHREAEQLTGLQVGGISALALLGRGFDIFIDKAALAHEQIFVSAGRRGTNLRLKVADLIAVTGAKAVEASTESPGA